MNSENGAIHGVCNALGEADDVLDEGRRDGGGALVE